MSRTVTELVGLYFDKIPYSEEAERARAAIVSAMEREYERLSGTEAPDEELIGRYGKLSQMAALAGYSPEDVGRWRDAGDACELKTAKKAFRAERWRVYFISAFAVFTLSYLLQALFITPFFLVHGAVCGFITWRLFLGLKKRLHSERFDINAHTWLRSCSDRYAKRSLNSIALFFAVAALFVASELTLYILGNSKDAELAESVFSNVFILETPLFLVIKNLLCAWLTGEKIGLPERGKLKHHILNITLLSLAYWGIVTVLVLLLKNRVNYLANIYYMAAVVFLPVVIVYNLTARRGLTFRNLVFNPPRVAILAAAAVLVSGLVLLRRDTWYTQSFINSTPVVAHRENKITYDEASGVYTITASGDDFKILHLTDIHLGGSLTSYAKDIKALKACYAELENAHPDLVVVTGDMSFPMGIMSMSLNNTAPVGQFAAFMRNADIPWVFTYGNHDTESIASASQSDLNELFKSLSYKTSGTLLYPYVQPDIMGRNNQLVEVRNADGTLNTALFLIDSNAYTGEGINVYDYIHDDQVEWYAENVERLSAEAGHTVNSLVFFHIPLQQYRTAYELWEQGSDQVTYYFGENNEKMINKVCCSDYPSALFDKMVELGSTTGTFCGHDHYNNMSLEYKGIRLTYGMSIDYLAMPGIERDTAQRGAEIITLHPDSSWELEQVPLTSLTTAGE